MAGIYHKETGFYIGDPAAAPFPPDYAADNESRRRALAPLVLSASGWRKVFAEDGNEDSRNEAISPADRELAAAMAEVFAAFIAGRSKKPTVAVGLDSRFTGPRIADVIIRVFLLRGIAVRYLFITPAPEIMAYVKETPDLGGFAYVSASHNPIGHNGLKFGLRGGVLGGKDSAELILSFRNLVSDNSRMEKLIRELRSAAPAGDGSEENLRRIFSETAAWKKAAEAAYGKFARKVITNRSEAEEQEAVLDRLRREIGRRGCGVVLELNGSARTVSIDSGLLEDLGVKVKVINGRPRQITHAIVPEGASLDICRGELEAARWEEPAFIFGCVPDNDGDRGNIVIYDETAGRARALEAQEVFSLACASELAFLHAEEPRMLGQKLAIAVNDPTSLRIDRIARAMGAEVRRAEVGEANVVALAAQLRSEGRTVRILGEGSNGGNITHPSEVRDPLSTIFALLKILYLPEPFRILCRAFGRSYKPRPNVADVLAALPVFTTLSAYDPDALLDIRAKDHGALKARYESIFLREWDRRREHLASRFGIVSWEELNHEGTTVRSGMGPEFRSGGQRGGLTILLKDSAAETRAFLWMRGSGTEPVFRILVDVEGADPEKFGYLLAWHRSMVLEADATC